MRSCIRYAIAFLMSVLTIICSITSVSAMGLYQWEINISYTNAPQGTAFVDILFKTAENDIYAPNEDSSIYTERTACTTVALPDTDIELASDCGLAEYDDGFTSCMMRRYFVSYNSASDGKCTLKFPQPCNADNDKVFQYYGEFKAAYCDRDGNVLLVTEPVKVKPHKHPCVYEVSADGNTADCHAIMDNSIYIAPVIIGCVIIIPIIIIFSIAMAVSKKKANKTTE